MERLKSSSFISPPPKSDAKAPQPFAAAGPTVSYARIYPTAHSRLPNTANSLRIVSYPWFPLKQKAAGGPLLYLIYEDAREICLSRSRTPSSVPPPFGGFPAVESQNRYWYWATRGIALRVFRVRQSVPSARPIGFRQPLSHPALPFASTAPNTCEDSDLLPQGGCQQASLPTRGRSLNLNPNYVI